MRIHCGSCLRFMAEKRRIFLNNPERAMYRFELVSDVDAAKSLC